MKQGTDYSGRSYTKVTVLQLNEVHPSINNDVQGSQWSEMNLFFINNLASSFTGKLKGQILFTSTFLEEIYVKFLSN